MPGHENSCKNEQGSKNNYHNFEKHVMTMKAPSKLGAWAKPPASRSGHRAWVWPLLALIQELFKA
jgi:hypothetical protein